MLAAIWVVSQCQATSKRLINSRARIEFLRRESDAKTRFKSLAVGEIP